jgi:hypothetical protein
MSAEAKTTGIWNLWQTSFELFAYCLEILFVVIAMLEKQVCRLMLMREVRCDMLLQPQQSLKFPLLTGCKLDANFVLFWCSHLCKSSRKPDAAVGQAVASEFRD